MVKLKKLDERVINGWESINDIAIDHDGMIWMVSDSSEKKIRAVTCTLDPINVYNDKFDDTNPRSIGFKGGTLYIGDSHNIPRLTSFNSKGAGMAKDYPGIDAKRIRPNEHHVYVVDQSYSAVDDNQGRLIQVYGKNVELVMAGVKDIAAYEQVYALVDIPGSHQRLFAQITPYVIPLGLVPDHEITAFAVDPFKRPLMAPKKKGSAGIDYLDIKNDNKEHFDIPFMAIGAMLFDSQDRLVVAGTGKEGAKIMRFEYDGR
ncbi:MAG: hypothetical protein KKE20_05610 [Nanoarchaeota archaeon]|nr:hypothetical protein [Nanoarchaeota archaeon]